MQRQATNPSRNLVDLVGGQRGGAHGYDPTDEDRIIRLQDSTKKGLLKSTEKKKLLIRIIEDNGNLKKKLLKLAKEVGGTTDLEDRLEIIIKDDIKTKHKTNAYNNKELSAIIVSLFDIMALLEAQLNNKQRPTRRTSTQGDSKPTPLQALISTFTTLHQDVDKQINKLLQEVGNNDPLLKGLSLDPSQKSLTFDPTRIPDDDAHTDCPFCTHPSLNTSADNDGMGTRNNDKHTKQGQK